MPWPSGWRRHFGVHDVHQAAGQAVHAFGLAAGHGGMEAHRRSVVLDVDGLHSPSSCHRKANSSASMSARWRVVGGAAVAAFDVLVQPGVVPLLAQPRRHLARMAGVHAVVARAGGEQHRRQPRGRVGHVLVGAVLRDPVPLRRVVRVAVFAHPAGAGQQPVVAPHVQQRHLADHGAEQLGPLQHHRADQQPAVAAALDGQAPRIA